MSERRRIPSRVGADCIIRGGVFRGGAPTPNTVEDRFTYRRSVQLFYVLIKKSLSGGVLDGKYMGDGVFSWNNGQVFLLFFFITLGLEMSDTKVYEP